MPKVGGTDKPVAVKLLYIKMIFLVDQKKHKGNPVFKRALRRSGDEFPVYDSSVFYQFTHFGRNKPDDHEWAFTSSRGQVDAFQWHPFDRSTAHADPAKTTDPQRVEGFLDRTPETLVVLSHNYNGFQRVDGEWCGVRAANDTGLLRLVFDLSSVMTAPGKELFVKHPRAYWVHERRKDPADSSQKLKTPLEFEFDDGRVFSVSQTSVPKKDILEIRYKMNWDSLVLWKAYHAKKKVIPITITRKI